MDTIIQYTTENYIDITATGIGLLYLYLEYKASTWMWVASIVMAVFFIYIFYSVQLYANMAIYTYFFIASIYGLAVWITKNRNRQTGEHIITHAPKRYIRIALILVFVVFALLIPILLKLTDNHPSITIGDALTTSLNIVALWMATRKWVEQWCLLIPANFIYILLLFAQGAFASSIMFSFYFVGSIFGYLNWKKLALKG